MNGSIYDENYYQNGLNTGKSGYHNYRWLPSLTKLMVSSMINYLGIEKQDTILDYGCAFGYVVKAFRQFGIKAWGADISEYAISNADPEIAEYCTLLPEMLDINFDWCLAKDVLEHVEWPQLLPVLEGIHADNMFAVIPLGENGEYYADYNNLDITHVTCEPLKWWKQMFLSTGWDVKKTSYSVPGIKGPYSGKAHGFFTLKRGGK